MSDLIWVLIPIFGIMAGSFSQWLKLKAKQQQLGTSTEGLAKELSALKSLNGVLAERVQNLEAIVVSQTWDALHDRGLSPVERDLKVASAVRREIKGPDTTSANQHRAEQLAQRLRG